MKKILFMSLVIAAAFTSTAQTKKSNIGGYGAGTADITFINGKAALSVGAYGGVLINHKLLIGAGGNNIMFKQNVNGKSEKFQFNYYGLYTEYRILSLENTDVTVGVLGGMGWLENQLGANKGSMKRDGDITHVIQPKLGINLSVTKFMQVQAYGGYRFTGNTNSANYTAKNMNGFNGGIGLVFGSF
jgi:hypothetical protein